MLNNQIKFNSLLELNNFKKEYVINNNIDVKKFYNNYLLNKIKKVNELTIMKIGYYPLDDYFENYFKNLSFNDIYNKSVESILDDLILNIKIAKTKNDLNTEYYYNYYWVSFFKCYLETPLELLKELNKINELYDQKRYEIFMNNLKIREENSLEYFKESNIKFETIYNLFNDSKNLYHLYFKNKDNKNLLFDFKNLENLLNEHIMTSGLIQTLPYIKLLIETFLYNFGDIFHLNINDIIIDKLTINEYELIVNFDSNIKFI